MGYFILGPSDLYKLTKEIGKFLQSFRTLSAEASKSFESTMENQLELEELRKAQSELNNAFSFRRSINVDDSGEAFSEKPPMVDGGVETPATVAAAAAASTGEGTKKKKRKRVKKKKVQPPPSELDDIPPYSGDIPDLDMSEEFKKEMKEQLWSKPESGIETEVEAATRARNERLDRLQNGQPSTPPDWYSASESDIASEVLNQQQTNGDLLRQPSPAESAAEQTRFASQLSGNWNDQILANEDKLSPLGKIMERLAILEEEKNAADARLEEEFRLRADNEEKFYREKRKLLEEASAEVAASTYNFDVEEETKPAEVAETTESAPISNSTNTTATTTISVKKENSAKVTSVKEEENSTKVTALKEENSTKV